MKRIYFIIQFCVPVLIFLSFSSVSIAQQSRLSALISGKDWDILFPHRYGFSVSSDKTSTPKDDLFSYKAFLAAAESFPSFLSGNDILLQKRELCALLANMAYETGGGWDAAPGGYYKWGLYFPEEKNCEEGCPHYSDTTKKNYSPVAGRSYHGRGPLQLSWNYNYGQFSEDYFHDRNILLQDPSLLTRNGEVCFASALWFWTKAQYPKPSCHDIMYGLWKPASKDSAAGRFPGFGAVVNVINGGLECGGNTTAGSSYRYGYYLYFCRYFNVDPGAALYCKEQQPFGQ